MRNERRSGAAATRNRGIRAATGLYLAFQDDDDIWLLDRLKRQLETLENSEPRVGLCLCGHIRLEPGRAVYVGGLRAFGKLDFQNGVSRDHSLIATPGWMLRRSALDRVGLFDERLRVWHDWELGFRLSQAYKLVHHPEPLYVQDRISGGDLSRNQRAQVLDSCVLMERYGALWSRRNDVISRHHFRIGRMLCSMGSVRWGRARLCRAIRAYPLNVPAWGALCASIGGPVAVRGATDAGRWARTVSERLGIF